MGIETFQLSNGMQVVLEENHASKVVSFNALVKVGSANESDEEAGICHAIEHMLFKGTPARPAGAIARDVEAAGGEINAYTSIDQTVFFINMATRFADRGLSILADAIQNPLFDADELGREKEVILEEIRREQDNPHRMLTEELFRAAFREHTYGRPIIGFPKTVSSFTQKQILDFYRRWYSPHNMVFIAVGDFEVRSMLEAIRGQFANFDRPGDQAPCPPAVKEEPPQRAPRLVVRTMNIQSAYLAMAFHAPRVTHGDVPALDVLAHILGGADSSRLEQEIKEKKRLVHNIYAYSFTPKDPGLFVIGATLADADLKKAVRAIGDEIARIQESPVTSEELSRARLNIRSNETYDKETVGGQASKIAYFIATAGSHEFERRYYQMLADVSNPTLNDVARRYLTPENCTAVALVPDSSRWVKSKAVIAAAISRSRPKALRAAMASRPKPHRIRLKNGARLLLLENHNLPLVSICAVALGGTRFETLRDNGVSGLYARTLTKGTSARSAVEIAKEIERIAGHIDGFSGRNTVGLKCEFLSDHLREGFCLFAEILTRPAFAAEEVAREKRIVLRAIRDQEDALPSLAFSEFLKALFPKHPYGLRSLGTIESVKSLKRRDLIGYHRKVMRSEGLVLSVVGDVNRQEAIALAEELFEGLPRGMPRPPSIKADPILKSIREVTITKRDKQQAHIVLGFQGTTFRGKDRYAMSVLNNILSGQGGRLFLALRDRMSLAYAVSSVNQEGIDPGYFAVYIGTEPGKQKRAVAGILKELGSIRTEAVGADEIERSKQYLVGAYELDMQRNSALAGIYAFNEAYGIGMDEIDRYPQRILAVTREDVLASARRYIMPEAYTLAVVRPGTA